jgi:hypothetical protein
MAEAMAMVTAIIFLPRQALVMMADMQGNKEIIK